MRDWSAKSRRNMRYVMSALDWRHLGRRPAMITLTYPGDWRTYAPDGPAVRRSFKAFLRRWERQWGEPCRGVWVREFQERGAPHYHCYFGLPEAVSDEDYAYLTRRHVRRRALEAEFGKYQGRRSGGMLLDYYETPFGQWLLAAWSGSVGTPARSLHRRFGADVAPMFWGATVVDAQAGRVNWARIADYLWKESGKWGQKTVPAGFNNPGQGWGRLGGMPLVITEGEMQRDEFFAVRQAAFEVRRRRSARPWLVKRSRGKDGMTLFNAEPELQLRLLAWGREGGAMRAARRDGLWETPGFIPGAAQAPAGFFK